MLTTKERVVYGELKLPFKHSYINGEIYPSFIKESTLEEIRNFKLRPDDVFIATYPKNGTTWTQGLIQKLHAAHKTGHLQVSEDTHLLKIIPWLENNDITMIANMSSPRYLKTHNSYFNIAYDSNVPCKYIYVARNPKDVCVSMWHHCRAFHVFKYDGEFDEFGELFLKGHVESSDWWAHVKNFYLNPRKMDILFLKYEDIHTNGIEIIQKINNFIGLPKLSDEQAEEVREDCTFKKMKNDPARNHEWVDILRKKECPKFMRLGKVGDWRNYFSDDLSARFDEKTREMFSGLDLNFMDEF